ncbi:MAG: YihY/virulence factor BrkB family protein, partial [Candidatus Binatia bacterium]
MLRKKDFVSIYRGVFDHPLIERAAKVVRGFQAHRGPVRAASLAFTTLLALVPMIALVLGVSKAVIRTQDSQTLVRWVDRALNSAVPQLQYLSENEADDARANVLARIQESIDKIDAGALGIFGSLVLVSVAISLLSAIEYALNDVWGVARGRGFAQRVVYYWAGVTLGPLLLFVSLGLTGSVAVDRVLGQVPGGFATAAFWWILPFLTLGTGFTLLYWTMPNTTVPFRAAAIGGFAAGAVFQANNMLSVLYFSRVVGYSAVYGSLGAIPVLMLGIYVSWMIVLLGAEISHVAASPPLEETAVPSAFDARVEIALGVARAATAAFLEGRVGATRDEIASALDVPAAWVNA